MESVIRSISTVPMRDPDTGVATENVFFIKARDRLIVWDGNRAWIAHPHPSSTLYTLIDKCSNRKIADIRGKPIDIGTIGVAIAELRTAARRSIESAFYLDHIDIDDDAVIVYEKEGSVTIPKAASIYTDNVDAEVLEAETHMTTGEAARMLAVSDDTIRRLIDRGELQAMTTKGGHHRIPLASVVQYARKRKQEFK